MSKDQTKEEILVSTEEKLVPKLTEFETKYRVDNHMLPAFKALMDTQTGLEKFIYVEGPDYYFTNGKGDNFIRYRRPSHGLDNGRSEVTVKIKPEGAKNNIIREEVNIRVDNTPEENVRRFVELMGYQPNFSIWKVCHIYIFKDVTLVFYSVFDSAEGKATKQDNFVEIEISEEKVSEMTEDQAWAMISHYEKVLESIGINPQKRLRKSLFEMYRK